jgi:hypothetical protein
MKEEWGRRERGREESREVLLSGKVEPPVGWELGLRNQV